MKDKEKAKGRPKVETGKWIKKIDARFTEAEYAIIQDLEKTLGVRKTDLVRSGILKDAHVTAVNAKALVGFLDSISAELGRCGNNINQLAKHANILNKRNILSPAIIGHFNLLFEQYLSNQKKLEAALRKIIRSLGNSQL